MSKEGASSTQCTYIESLCSIGINDFDDAKYSLSVLSTTNSGVNGFSDINGLALASLVEIAYLSGDYKKARTLSEELNSLLSKKLPDSYPYMISEVLLAKSYYDAKDSLAASDRISVLELIGMDPIMYCSINP